MDFVRMSIKVTTTSSTIIHNFILSGGSTVGNVEAAGEAQENNALKNKIRRQVAEVERVGEKMVVPSAMSIDEAIKLLQSRKAYEEETVIITDSFDVFPWDGALALDRVLTTKFGWAPAKAQMGFFGPNPPRLITVEVGYGMYKQVPWGQFQIPTIDGTITCGVDQKDGRYVFAVHAKVKRKDEETVQVLFAEIRRETHVSSIYRGKAIKIRFCSDEGKMLEMPEPRFMDTTTIDESQLVFSADVMSAVNVNLFTPIRRAADCLANGIPIKRGVLLGGPYGTGKTMAAAVASKYAEAAGVTFVYCSRADELQRAIDFAKQYQNPAACVFCEDIDRVMAGERSVEIDDILNTIDGIDSKANNIVVVLTTNKLTEITPAMLRPGRLDAVIEVTPPDGKAVEALLRGYGRGYVRSDEDLTQVGAVLAGQIPAIVAEVVKRAKLSQLTLLPPGEKVTYLSATALLDAAKTLKSQILLIERQSAKEDARTTPTLENAFRAVISDVIDDGGPASLRIKVDEIHAHTTG